MKRFFSESQAIKSLLPALVMVLMAGIAYASGGGEGHEAAHDGALMKDFWYKMLNFVVLVGFLYWFLAKKIKEFFSGRRTEIKNSLTEAQAAKEEAEAKFKEYSAKLDKATDEISGVVEMIRAQGQAEKEKIVEDAKKAAQKIEEDTKARMEQEFKSASNELRQEAVLLSVQMAEELLKRSITAQDHDAMVRDYLDKVVIKH